MAKLKCSVCKDAISELGGHVKLSGQSYAHLACYTDHVKEEATEAAQQTAAAAKVPASAGEDKPKLVMARKEWDDLAMKVINRHVINYGPMMPQDSLKRFLHNLYQAFLDAGLVVQVIEEKPAESKLGPTLEEFLKGE